MSIDKAGYLAGLIDGEGSLFISRYRLRLTVTNTHTAIIKLCNTYGGAWQYVQKRNRPKERPFYTWEWNNEMIRHYLPQVLPHLIIKSEQAKIMLEALQCCRGTRGTVEETRKRNQKLETYARKLRELNKKAFPLP